MQKKERNEELEYIDELEDVEEPEEPEDNREELEEPEEEYSEGGRRRKKGRKSDTKNAASVAGEFLSWVITIVAAVLIAMFLNRFVLINAEIPSGSMENTIMTGDKLIGFRWSYLFSGPERGDIIIFKFPEPELCKTCHWLSGRYGKDRRWQSICQRRTLRGGLSQRDMDGSYRTVYL